MPEQELTALRHQFLLLHEADLLARFGTPTSIEVFEPGPENWVYFDEARGIHLRFTVHRGRVIRM